MTDEPRRDQTDDPRAALTALVAAFERHLEACASRRGEDDPTVLASADDLADAFESYDDALLAAYGEMTPLEVYGAEDDFDDDEMDEDERRELESRPVAEDTENEVDDHDEEDGDDGPYSGFESDYDWGSTTEDQVKG